MISFGSMQDITEPPDTFSADDVSGQTSINVTGEDVKANPEGYLWAYLDALKSYDFSQFVQECQEQTYAFTEFTYLVYLKFCNRSKLETRCFDGLQNIVDREKMSSTWNDLIHNMNLLQIDDADLINPCLQVAMLNKAILTQSRFHEVIALVPFCSVVWCGFDEDVFIHRDATSWICIPNK